jgi:hypothetical protein
MRTKHGNHPKAVTKAKELDIHQLLSDADIPFSYQHHLPFKGCGLSSETTCAHADFVLQAAWGAIVLEVDEHQHSHQPPNCDVRRDFDIAASVALGSGGKLIVLRFNPDPFSIGGVTQRLTKKERQARLLTLLGKLEAQEPELPFSRLYLFYDVATPHSELPLVAEQWDSTIARQISRVT